jgi:NAD(P)-dependent dehydrogenase (short-subunit alcohol dehydrogenase family)
MALAGRTSLQGKIVVITGATSGIGQVAAERLATMGARIVLVARDKARGEAMLARLRARKSGVVHSVHYADLSRLADMKRVGAEIAAAEPRIDVLINNAGALFAHRKVTADGLEMTFATNHVAYFVLTHCLRGSLAASAPARVVNTASRAHQGARLDFADLQMAHRYRPVEAYNRSKLCNILFTRELARRWADIGVTANCLHPGFVATRFGDNAGGLLAFMVRMAKTFAIPQDEGADTIVHLASAPEVAGVSGAYFYKRMPIAPSVEAQDDASAKRLWDETACIAGTDFATRR